MPTAAASGDLGWDRSDVYRARFAFAGTCQTARDIKGGLLLISLCRITELVLPRKKNRLGGQNPYNTFRYFGKCPNPEKNDVAKKIASGLKIHHKSCM